MGCPATCMAKYGVLLKICSQYKPIWYFYFKALFLKPCFVSAWFQVWVVADVGKASVGLWKNCSNGNCEGALPYANEGTCKAIAFSADNSCDGETSSLSGIGWPDTLALLPLCPQMRSRQCRPSWSFPSSSLSSPSWSSCSSSSPWRRETDSSSREPPCWCAVSIRRRLQFTQAKLLSRSYHGCSRQLEKMSTWVWLFVLFLKTPASCLE